MSEDSAHREDFATESMRPNLVVHIIKTNIPALHHELLAMRQALPR
jgi:hypothetical protein